MKTVINLCQYGSDQSSFTITCFRALKWVFRSRVSGGSNHYDHGFQAKVLGGSDQSWPTYFREKLPIFDHLFQAEVTNLRPRVSGGSDYSLTRCFRRKWQIFLPPVSGGSEQVPGHLWDRAGGDPAPQPHERNSPFSMRGEEGSLLPHPHLRSNCHAGEPIKHLLLTYLCPAFANIVSGNIHCTQVVKRLPNTPTN